MKRTKIAFIKYKEYYQRRWALKRFTFAVLKEVEESKSKRLCILLSKRKKVFDKWKSYIKLHIKRKTNQKKAKELHKNKIMKKWFRSLFINWKLESFIARKHKDDIEKLLSECFMKFVINYEKGKQAITAAKGYIIRKQIELKRKILSSWKPTCEILKKETIEQYVMK